MNGEKNLNPFEQMYVTKYSKQFSQNLDNLNYQTGPYFPLLNNELKYEEVRKIDKFVQILGEADQVELIEIMICINITEFI